MAPGRVRLFVGLLVCVVLPLGSKVFADGVWAYTMYSATVVYRVEIAAYDDGGRSLPVAPTDVAPLAGPFAAPFLFGAEKPRRLPQIAALRAHLADVGRLACARASATRVVVTLFEGAEVGALQGRTVSVACKKTP